MAQISLEIPLLSRNGRQGDRNLAGSRALIGATAVIAGAVFLCWATFSGRLHEPLLQGERTAGDVINSETGVAAADDWRCSEIGVAILRDGGHAVDSAVATAICLGVVNPVSSGIGGGGFMVIRSAQTDRAEAYDFRETAPLAASPEMYGNNSSAKANGPLSVGVPGELAGLHAAWVQHGRLPWENLFRPSVRLARDGFTVAPYLAAAIKRYSKAILRDRGLREVYAPNGRLLEVGDTCRNPRLGYTLDVVSKQGPQAFYNGTVGEMLIRDIQKLGGILTEEDLRQYKVNVNDVMAVNVMGYTVLGMPLPSSGTVGLALVLNILESYQTVKSLNNSTGLHHLVESLKHMFAIRMNLGDPAFVDVSDTMSNMLSKTYSEKIRRRILDNTTFPSGYYLARWSQVSDHGTSHFCIVDADRNAVSLTTSVNYLFGAKFLSHSTGIVLNNVMDDFSIPTEEAPDKLPPAFPNFIQPNKRPLSSMSPFIILKDNQLAGAVGGSGGIYIIPAVIQVFLNHFVMGMDPLTAVQQPRVYHKLIPNVLLYENWTLIDGDHIELSQEAKLFLEQRGHVLKGQATGAMCQLVVHNLHKPANMEVKDGQACSGVYHGILTAVSDPRKDGKPAGI